MTAAEAIAMADLEEVKRLTAEFEATDGDALTVAIAQEAEPGNHMRKCYLAHERLRVSEARSINRAETLSHTWPLHPLSLDMRNMLGTLVKNTTTTYKAILIAPSDNRNPINLEDLYA